MIKAVIILNSCGKVRFIRVYDQSFLGDEAQEEALIRELYGKALDRAGNASNFLVECTLLHDAFTLICRRYATLFFVLVCDKNENELALLDFVHIFVETIGRVFVEANELDILYNPEKVNYVLDELIVDGVVIQTSMREAASVLDAQTAEEQLGYFY